MWGFSGWFHPHSCAHQRVALWWLPSDGEGCYLVWPPWSPQVNQGMCVPSLSHARLFVTHEL